MKTAQETNSERLQQSPRFAPGDSRLAVIGLGYVGLPLATAAADPPRRRGHADPIGVAIIAHHGAHGMRAVEVVVAREGRIGTTIAAAAMDGVVPVVVVIRRYSVPAAILLDQGRVMPLVAGVDSPDDNTLPPVTLSPYVGGADLDQIPLDAFE